jgi:hypothetical protein
MMELSVLASRYGLLTVAGAAVVFILLKSEIQFRYPRKK